MMYIVSTKTRLNNKLIMKKVLLLIMMAMTISLNGFAQVYNEEINTAEQIDGALAKAKTEGKYVICQVGGNWCPWCLKFAKFITEDADIKALVEENFVYEHVNYPRRGGNREAQAETMKRLGNPQRFGFPVMVVLDENGKVVHIQDSSYLEEDKSYDKEKVVSFFKHWTKSAVEGE